MKAAVYSKTTSGKVVDLADVAKPIPKDNEVLIQVCSASVNPLDWRMKKPRPGVDVAGRVASVGRAVTKLKPGDAVFGVAQGSFAEYACASETKLAVKPELLSFEQAAAIPVAGLTAFQGLRDHGHLQPGQKILINGAAGGVGTFAVQIAKSLGAEITAVCSSNHSDLVRSLGASHVIDYARVDVTRSSERYDLILDNVGNRTLSDMRRVLAPGGKCVMVGAPKKLWQAFTRIGKAFLWSLSRSQKMKFLFAQIKPDGLNAICDLIAAGKLTPIIDRRYPLADAARAMDYVEEGHAAAKVIITIS